jgi:hypothetical protein
MKAALNWVRTNPILVVAAVLCLAALVSLVIIIAKGSSFTHRVAGRSGKLDEIKGLERFSFKLPAETPDGEPLPQTITVNPVSIEAITEVYGRMTDEAQKIFGRAIAFNREGMDPPHLPMLEGLFPSPGSETHKLFTAKMRYREAFDEMLRGHTLKPNYPRLNAGGPINLQPLDQIMVRVQNEYLNRSLFAKTYNELTEEEVEELKKLKTEATVRYLREEASRIHIYAETDRGMTDYPFDVALWVNQPESPTMPQLWEGQMGLWMQQDIVQAISTTNRVADSNASVLTSPVKHLIRIEVGNRYVGLELKMPAASGGMSGMDGMDGMGGMGGMGGMSGMGGGDGEDDLYLSPTGRTSNEIYDVRHIRVQLVVDWHRITELMDSLARTNFMTVLKMDVVDVNEFDAMRQGYVYGAGDAVYVDMLIESLWLRDWTTSLMPKDVRYALDIPEAQQEQGDTVGASTGGGRSGR